MKRLIFALTLLVSSVAQVPAGMHLGVSGKHTMTGLPPDSRADKRQLVQIPPMMRNHMLGNMRDHLLALSEIQQALSEGEFEKAAEIAESRLGMTSTSAHGAQRMGPHMPEGMRKLGIQMHRAASQFALTAQESGVEEDFKRSIGALSRVTRQCVACHAAYRVN